MVFCLEDLLKPSSLLEADLDGDAIGRFLDDGFQRFYCPEILGLANEDCGRKMSGGCGVNDDCAPRQRCRTASNMNGFVCEVPLAPPPSCDEGWFQANGTCYRASPTAMNWQDAKKVT